MIVYASRTGNVKYIVDRLGIESVKIEEGLVVRQPFFIFTYTDGLGEVPQVVKKFMSKNYKYCKGVIASGNTNFGDTEGGLFCKSAEELSKVFNIPVIRKIDLRGYQQDYDHIIAMHNEIIGGATS